MFYNSLHARLTVFTGPGKGSGKTSALQAAAIEAQRFGPVGVFTIGFDGVNFKSPPMRFKPGDIVITSIPMLRAAGARLCIIEALPGRSAIGQLCVARVARSGPVALAGPEHLSQLAIAIDFIRQNSLVNTVLVDGAAGRITQIGALPDAQFIYCAQADAANFLRVAENIELISKLADLPLDAWDTNGDGLSGGAKTADNVLCVEGPLTVSMADALPNNVECVSIGALSDCFLDAASFKRLSRRCKITVRRQIPLLGFAVALRNVKRETLLDALPSASARVIFNPYTL